jgi:hypothetical protein
LKYARINMKSLNYRNGIRFLGMALAMLALGACSRKPAFTVPTDNDARVDASARDSAPSVMPPVVVVDKNGQLVESGASPTTAKAAVAAPRFPPYVFIPPPPAPPARVYSGVGSK